jgi:hypothetical protein
MGTGTSEHKTLLPMAYENIHLDGRMLNDETNTSASSSMSYLDKRIPFIHEQLPIIQEIDRFLTSEKFKETFETVISISSPSYEILTSKLPLALKIQDPDTIREILHTFFAQLKRGILYVYEKFGIVADHFDIIGDTCIGKIGQFEGYTLRYVPELDLITIDYESLAVICLCILNDRKASIAPIEHCGENYRVSIKDAIFLGGVEEAHHAYFTKSKKISSYEAPLTREEYRSNPIEIAAWTAVRQAILENGIQIYLSLKNGHYMSIPWNCPEPDIP